MGLEQQFTKGGIEKQVALKIQRKLDAVMQSMQFVGERFIKNGREKAVADEGYREAMRAISGRPKVAITEATPRFADRTSNLQSSYGYLILQDSQVYHSRFDGEESIGRATGEAAAAEVAAQYPSGIVLIVVVGMQYAAAVESLGYDVLTGSSFEAERDLKELLNGLKN